MLFKKKKNKESGIYLIFLRKNGKYEFTRMTNIHIPEISRNDVYTEVPIAWKKDGKKDVMHVVREGKDAFFRPSDNFLFESSKIDTITPDNYCLIYPVPEETLEKIPGNDHIEKCRNLLLHYVDGLKIARNENYEWISYPNPIGRMALTLKEDIISGKHPYDIIYEYSVKYGFDCDKFTMMIEQIARIKYETKTSEETIKRFGDALLDYATFLEQLYTNAKLGYEDYPSLLFGHANNPLNITNMVSPSYEENNENIMELRRKKVVLEEAREHINPLLTDLFEDDEIERNLTEYVLDSILEETKEKVDKELDKLDTTMPSQEEMRKRIF